MDISAVILSAGAGTRMKSKLPKVLHNLSGKEMIHYILEETKKITDNIDTILYHNHDEIKEKICNTFDNINIHIQNMQKFPGTGGALKELKIEAERVFILNGDTPLIQEKDLRDFLDIDADIVMSVIETENPDGYGRAIIENGVVKKIIEQKDANEEELKVKTVNAGIYLIKREILQKYIPLLNSDNNQNEYYLTDIIEMAVNDNKTIKPVFVNENSFKGVNTKLDLAKADEIMQNRIKEKLMLNGVLIKMPSSVYIDSTATFEGECIVENGVTILGDSHIIDSHIKTNSIVEDSKLENSSVGPMARIRPKSNLYNTLIGNFVEVKKSKLNGTKAGHLAYIGDSEIDEGTNIGAGVITCNYDGKAKYRTKIGKNVFVGSDVQLIAPIELEDDCIVAAGTTVTRDIPSGSLAINREPLSVVDQYYYKFFSNKKG